MRSIAWVLCIVAACGGRPAAVPAPKSTGPTIRGTIRIGDKVDPKLPRTGTLALYWMTKAEYDLVMSGNEDLGPLITLLRTLTVVGPVDVTKPVPYSLQAERGDIVVSAVIDSHNALIGGMFGHGGFGNLAGDSKPVHVTDHGTVDIVLDQVAEEKHPPDACSGERHELVTIDAPNIAGSIGNPTQRRACVILPPSYADAGNHLTYPVIYFFPGWGQNDSEAIAAFGYDKVFEAREAKASKQAILVIVDTSTKLGSTYLEDSRVQGAWETFIVRQLVPEIDRRYRTTKTPRSRATAGHSTGGFNAISIAFRHPELFGIATGSAPDGLDITRWLLGDDGAGGQVWMLPLLRAEAASGGAGILASYAGDWSPDESPRGFAFPLDPATGERRTEVIKRWREHSPTLWLSDPQRGPAIRSAFSGHVYVAVGKHDEFGLAPEAHHFDHELDRAHITHTYVETDGGHMAVDGIVGGAFDYALRTFE